MKTKQIAQFLTDSAKEILNSTTIVKEDLSNIIDLGKEIFTSDFKNQYFSNLVDRIAKTVFDNEIYTAEDLGIVKENNIYGGVLQKIYKDIEDFTPSKTWELQDNTEYNMDIYHAPKLLTKYYNNQVAYNIEISSLTIKQLQSAFTSKEDLYNLFNLIETSVKNSLELSKEILQHTVINNIIGETIKADYPEQTYTGKSGIRAINLLKLYNDTHTEPLTFENCLNNSTFIKFAVETIKVYKKRLTNITRMFNIGNLSQFTKEYKQNLILLNDFKAKIDTTILDTKNQSGLELNAKTVNYWQASGENYHFTDTSKIDIITASGATVTLNGILGVLFDIGAVGVYKEDFRVKSHENVSAEFINYWYKAEYSYYNDLNKNFLVFFIA